MYTSVVCQGRMTAGREFFEMDGNDHVIMVYFDTTREGNRAPIRKCIELADQNIGKQFDGKDSRNREFFIQSESRPGASHRGLGVAGDVEMMFVKSRIPVSHTRKKARIHHEGDTASVMYANVVRPIWKKLPQVDAATKAAIFGDAGKVCTDSVDPSKIQQAGAKRKFRIPRTARGAFPLNWWERSSLFYEEVIDNLNAHAVIDLFGSSNLAIACIMGEPPKTYMCLCRNNALVRALTEAVDSFIVREMGREGPPASKFFLAEIKDVVKRVFPVEGNEEEEDSEAASDDSED